MKKKILIGSIVMVTVLIGVSFTSVVSYGSVKSTSTVNSPLFNVRTRRAIGQGQQDITTDYLGQGEETNIHLSNRMKKTELTQKAINIISKMDDKAFINFVTQNILYLKNQEQITNKETLDVLQALHFIRGNPNDLKYYYTENTLDTFLCGIETLEYITCLGFPGCLIHTIEGIILIILVAIAGWITSHTCMGYTFGACCPD